MVGPGNAALGQQLAGERPEAPLHPVAPPRAADLLRDGDSEPHVGILVAAVADEQDEAGHGRPAAAIRREEIGPAGKDRVGPAAQADSVLRPRARRAASTLRPPTVAVRARKPWRRLRTRLLGWKVRFIAHSSNVVIKRPAPGPHESTTFMGTPHRRPRRGRGYARRG